MDLIWTDDGPNRWTTSQERPLFYRIFYSTLTKLYLPISYINDGAIVTSMQLTKTETLDGAKSICTTDHNNSPYKDL